MISTSRLNLLVLVFCAIVLLSVVLFLPAQSFDVFESPDDSSDYLATRLYAETGELWYTEDYTHLDEWNHLHPRHFVTHDDRIVPTEFLGLPVLYGPLYQIAGDNAAIVLAILFSLLSFIYFVKLASLLFGTKCTKFAAIIFIANAPLLYHLALPYLNVSGAVSFFIAASYYLARFYKGSSDKALFFSSLFFALSIFFRYEFVIFIGLFIAITLINKYKTGLRDYVRPVMLIGLTIAAFAIIPILALNYRVYGDPFTTGFKLLEMFAIERETTSLLQFLLPSPVILETILKNIYRLIFTLVPLLTLVSAVGILAYEKRRKISVSKMLYGALFLYILIYSGSSETWNAFNFDYYGFNTSIVRYWLLPYLFISVMAVAGFSYINDLCRRTKYKLIVPILAITLVATSVSEVLVENDRSLSALAQSFDNNQRIAAEIIDEIDARSIVFTGSYDKVLAPYRIEVATWWGGEGGYDPVKVAASMTRVYYEADYSVYLYARSSNNYINVGVLNSFLERSGLVLARVSGIPYLYSLEEAGP